MNPVKICSASSATERLFVQSSDFLKKKVQFILSVTSLQEMIASSRTVCFESGRQKDSINQETYSQSIDKEIKPVTAYAFSSICFYAYMLV